MNLLLLRFGHRLGRWRQSRRLEGVYSLLTGRYMSRARTLMRSAAKKHAWNWPNYKTVTHSLCLFHLAPLGSSARSLLLRLDLNWKLENVTTKVIKLEKYNIKSVENIVYITHSLLHLKKIDNAYEIMSKCFTHLFPHRRRPPACTPGQRTQSKHTQKNNAWNNGRHRKGGCMSEQCEKMVPAQLTALILNKGTKLTVFAVKVIKNTAFWELRAGS